MYFFFKKKKLKAQMPKQSRFIYKKYIFFIIKVVSGYNH
jgi:hypothetical protein